MEESNLDYVFLAKEIAKFDARPLEINNAAPPAPAGSDIVIGARIRPLLPEEVEDGQKSGAFAKRDYSVINVHELKKTVKGFPAISSSNFQLDRIYGPDDSSEAIYRDLVQPLIPWAWEGGVSTMFAYGQTGSGKTYTVSGLEKLAAKQLMEGTIERNRDVHLCIFEISGPYAYDLLNERHEVRLLQDSFGEMQLAGVVEKQPSNADELVALIEKGMSLRKSAPTLKNDISSRTHAICRIRIVNKQYAEIPDGVLFLIDLAGNEAAADTKEHNQTRMKEAKEINLSLATLKECIRTRAIWGSTEKEAKNVRVPYRNSVLTKVLKHVFDVKSGQPCKTVILACVNPSVRESLQSKNTLRYAEMLRVPIPKAKAALPRANIPSTWTNKGLKKWINQNSGEPPISSSLLAPSENGAQFCKLPKGEFISRCLKTPGITQAQARILYDKFRRTQIDAQEGSKAGEVLLDEADKQTKADGPYVPFQERLVPGMFIRYMSSNSEGAKSSGD